MDSHMNEGIRVPNIPRLIKQGGDELYEAVVDGDAVHLVRDWRASDGNSQMHQPACWGGRYMDMRLSNVNRNRPRVRRTVKDLVGIKGGRTVWCVMAGPSVVENIRKYREEMRTAGVVIGVNRGAVHYEQETGRSVDYWLIADGSITEEMCKRLWGGVPRGTETVGAIWCDPGLVDERTYWFRLSGWGHESAYCGVPMGLPDLEYSYNTGTIALHLADLLGAGGINILGCDLSLSNGQFHIGEDALLKDHRNSIVTQDLHGKVTISRYDQFIAARKMEAWAWILKTKYGVTVRNLTGAGILQRHMELS